MTPKSFHKKLINEAGALDVTERGSKKLGHYKANYGPFRVWLYDGNTIRVAPKWDFDRWANSTVYEGPVPKTIREFDEILVKLKYDN